MSFQLPLHKHTSTPSLPPLIFGMPVSVTHSKLLSTNTWDLVPKPPNANVVSNKWIFKIKRNSDGKITRYKARLVAKGFTQQEGTGYQETFSPVIKETTIRTTLALAVMHH